VIYCFKHPSGEVHEQSFPIGTAPASIFVDGVECPRDFGSEIKHTNDAACHFAQKYPYVSKRLPKNMPGCPTAKNGHSVVVSARHEREICSRYGYSRE